MIAILVITAFFGFLFVCAEVAQFVDARDMARVPMKVPEWRPSIPMYFVKDEFLVTHWLGTDLELAKLYMEPGWKLGEGHPNLKVEWTWVTYDEVFPKPTTGPIETVGPVGPIGAISTVGRTGRDIPWPVCRHGANYCTACEVGTPPNPIPRDFSKDIDWIDYAAIVDRIWTKSEERYPKPRTLAKSSVDLDDPPLHLFSSKIRSRD